MLGLDELVAALGYSDSSRYYTQVTEFEPETAHLFRAAQEIGITGAYVIQTSSSQSQILPPQPVVYVANIQTEDEQTLQTKVREIHRGLWNLCFAPFIILKLPHQIRVYTGFKYSETDEEIGLLESQLPRILENFSAKAIDTGQVWTKYAAQIQANQRVDKHLLANLKRLGKLLKEDGLLPETAHALIGKYVFLSYLRERDILSDKWLAQQGISLESIFTSQATRASLKRLVEALRDFNGKIFPINFADETLQDKHISWVAAIFKGDEPSKDDVEIWQLHLDFKAYDFRYIPVETLSVIYEQFLTDEDKKAKQEQGVVYTPEFLADYLLSEVASVRPLQRGMKILDPACGSGIFLVLAYRRLIESLGGKATPDQLRQILLESIYGIERKRDACFVAEFSLILTLLHYAEPSQLQDLTFKLPDLHNTRIFECDFFDFASESCEAHFWSLNLRFDWIVGNPPWVENPKTEDDRYIQAWFKNNKNKVSRPTGGKRVAEAFSWVIMDLLQPDGVAGLLLPATSLVNLESQAYRQQFFSQHEVHRVTNFANFRGVLFGKKNSGVLPAITLVYRLANENRPRPDILHYAPFVATQQTSETNSEPWIITINESEIKTISPIDAKEGETSLWKLALWGTPYDRRVLERLRWLFPNTLEDFCSLIGWGESLPLQGAEFCNDNTKPVARIKDRKIFDTTTFNQVKPTYRFSIPTETVLRQIESDSYIRRGEDALALTSTGPHLVLSPGWQNFAIYSENNFVIRPRQMGIAVQDTPEDRNLLRALTVYLSSNLVAYYLFFHVPEWGMFRQRKTVVTTEVRKVPTPIFTPQQAGALANLHQEVVTIEQEKIAAFVSGIRQNIQKHLQLSGDNEFDIEISPGGLPKKLDAAEKQAYDQFIQELHLELQTKIDETVFDVLNIPHDIRLLVADFMQYRLPLDTPAETENLIRPPSPNELFSYALALQGSLNDFAMGMVYHRVSITHSDELIECVVELTNSPTIVNRDDIRLGSITIADLLAELSHNLREQVSQWVYVQRGLRLFDGPRVYIYKSPRLIDWSYAQALNDAGDIIGSSLIEQWGHREAEPA